MKDLCQYGNRPEDEWEILPWIPDPRPPFKIWVKPEQIAPFFLIPHHPYDEIIHGHPGSYKFPSIGQIWLFLRTDLS